MPPRVPTESDLTSLPLPLATHLPSPPESTTTFLVLLHGFGDSESFVSFARAMNLPGVFSIAIRGPSPLPPSLLPEAEGGHFHWGDDVQMDPSTGEIAADPGFERARGKVMDVLVKDCLVDKFGWEAGDIILFGFGQGGSLALGLASSLANPRVEDAGSAGRAFKGVVSVGGPLPPSMVSTLSGRRKAASRALLVQVEDDDVDYVGKEFESVQRVRWKRGGVDMPRNRDEMYPIMKFLAEVLSPPHSFGGP